MIDLEKYFMKLAIEEAKITYQRGDLPVGAVLTINNKLIGRGGNFATTKGDWFSHAESSLLYQLSGAIKKSEDNTKRTLYTTWEPCLMCASISCLCRIDEIIYACPDPNGGVSKLDSIYLPEWYKNHWPKIKKGPFEKESYNLLTKYMKENREKWRNFLERFKI